MPTFINPAADLDDLVGFFEIGADDGGVMVDAVLCKTFADGLADLAEKLDALIAFARAHGCVQTLDEQPRSPAERQAIARAIVAASKDDRVVPFPFGAASVREMTFDGGSAA